MGEPKTKIINRDKLKFEENFDSEPYIMLTSWFCFRTDSLSR